MAKARRKTARRREANGGKIALIVVLCALLLALIGAIIGTAYKLTNGFAKDKPGNFYVEINGKKDYAGGDMCLPLNSDITFHVGYTLSSKSVEGYTVEVYSSCSEENAFTYKAAAQEYAFMDGVNFTDVFDITEDKDSFTFHNVNDDVKSILSRYHDDAAITELPKLDKTQSYFKLVITAPDAQQVTYNLTFGFFALSDGELVF